MKYQMEYRPTGRARCGFAGTGDSAEVTGGTDLADGHWHKVSCTNTTISIELTATPKP